VGRGVKWSSAGFCIGAGFFIAFVNDLDVNFKSKMFKFADDAKMVGRVGSKEGIDTLKEDLVSLFEWSENWQIKFNVS